MCGDDGECGLVLVVVVKCDFGVVFGVDVDDEMRD